MSSPWTDEAVATIAPLMRHLMSELVYLRFRLHVYEAIFLPRDRAAQDLQLKQLEDPLFMDLALVYIDAILTGLSRLYDPPRSDLYLRAALTTLLDRVRDVDPALDAQLRPVLAEGDGNCRAGMIRSDAGPDAITGSIRAHRDHRVAHTSHRVIAGEVALPNVWAGNVVQARDHAVTIVEAVAKAAGLATMRPITQEELDAPGRLRAALGLP